MANCESCIHKIVCKRYINDGISQELRTKMIEAGCENYMPYDVDKQNVTDTLSSRQNRHPRSVVRNVSKGITATTMKDTTLCDFCSYCRQKINERKE